MIIIIIILIIVAQSAKASERCSTPGRGGPCSHQYSRDHKCDYSSLPLLSLFNRSFFLEPHFLIYLVPIFLKFVLFIYLFINNVFTCSALTCSSMDRPAPARPPPHSPSPTSSSGCYSLPPIASNSILISVSFVTIALRVLLV